MSDLTMRGACGCPMFAVSPGNYEIAHVVGLCSQASDLSSRALQREVDACALRHGVDPKAFREALRKALNDPTQYGDEHSMTRAPDGTWVRDESIIHTARLMDDDRAHSIRYALGREESNR
jgi:hypothetical protein